VGIDCRWDGRDHSRTWAHEGCNEGSSSGRRWVLEGNHDGEKGTMMVWYDECEKGLTEINGY
jgi:hypothetical protein